MMTPTKKQWLNPITRRQFIKLGAAGAAGLMLSRPSFGRAQDLKPFTMQAAWVNDAEFMGYFVAMDNGYFTEEGLELNYLSGGPDVIPESSLLSDKADVALSTVETTITAITTQGAPFVIIGTQYQKSPVGIVSLADNPIMEPKALVGKTLAVPPVNRLTVEAMLKLNGIEPSEVRIVPYAYDPTPLIKGEIDASLDFTTNVPYTIKTQGAEAVSFLLYDFGFTVYNDVVVVTQDTLANKRAELVSWLRASRKGWEENFVDATKYPPMFADTWFKGTGRAVDNEQFFNTAQKPLIETEGGIFSMSEEGIANCIAALASIDIEAKPEYFDTSLLAEI
jgi:ABC-type nitrate/sulfonate/bicarbonate transport system substrate-binding protein